MLTTAPVSCDAWSAQAVAMQGQPLCSAMCEVMRTGCTPFLGCQHALHGLHRGPCLLSSNCAL